MEGRERGGGGGEGRGGGEGEEGHTLSGIFDISLYTSSCTSGCVASSARLNENKFAVLKKKKKKKKINKE